MIDNAIALRIIWLLTSPFEKWSAYKSGIIDAEGNVISPGAKSDDWSMLHRLVARIKKVIGILPGGKSQFASYAAAYALVKENIDNDSDILKESKLSFRDWVEFNNLIEDIAVPANNVTNVAGAKPGEEPPVRKQKTKLIKRKQNDRHDSDFI